jgi:hypothetical protein
MSLHVLANHMATKGRGSDSMLVHMTPAEVASLQALAMKNGGSLTINPDTGLPEAGFLKKLLPAIAGFALNAFAPGFGTAIGGALGLGGAAGTAIGLGGITGLATGSLSKGLMAGLGAYGGASLAGSMMGAGTSSLAGQAASAAGLEAERAALAQGLSADTVAAMKAQAIEEAGNRAITSTAGNTLSAGFNAAKEAPGAFLKDNWKMGLAAASPFIADAMVPTTTKMPAATPGYIRPFQYDANTRTVKAMDPVLASEWGARQFPDFIRKEQAPPPAGLGQQLPPGMASGGIVALAEGGETDPYARFNTLSGQSKAAYDYLMGNTASAAPAGIQAIAPRPVVSNTNTPSTTTTPAKKDDDLPTLNPFAPTTGDGGGGVGGGAGPIMGGASVGNAVSDTDPSPTYSGFVPAPPNPDIPVVDITPTPVTPPQGDPYDQPYTLPQGDPYDQPYTLPQGDPYDQPYIPDPEPVDPNFFEPGYGNTGVPEPVPYQGDPYDQPYTLPQGDPYDQPYDNSDYEVQDWENVDNSGYTDNSMAGDNSLNSGNNTYTGETDSVQQQGLPDAFGSYPGEPTYIGNPDGGSYDGFVGDDNNIDEDRYDYAGNANGGLMGYANGGMMPRYALGGLGALGGYSDGGRLLKGPGDGVSDSIPATIGRKKQPARLADGEFVVPARIVSELGNGSTEAGARKLYAMMDRIQKARGKTVGKGKVAANSRSEKHLPA